MPVRLLLAAALGGCGTDEAPDPQPSQRSQPLSATSALPGGLVFATTTIDFGEVFQGSEALLEVPFRNAGGAPVRILDVIPTCGCAAAVPDARDIPPGGSGILTVTFKPEDRRGTVRSLVLVRTDAPADPDVTLNVTAVARPVFAVVPPVLDLGEMPRGAEIVREFVVRETTGRPFAVAAVAASRPDVTAEALPAGPAAAERRIRITARTEAASGPFLMTVTVSTDRAGVPAPAVLVQGTVRGDVEVSPASFFLGGIGRGERFPPQVVTVTGRVPFTIAALETGDPAVRAAELPGGTDRERRIEITVEGPLPPGRFEKTFRIRTSAPGPPLEVIVSGVVVEAK